MTSLRLQMDGDKLPLAMLHSFVCLARHHFGTGLDARCNLTPARPRTSHELLTPCSSPLQRKHSLACKIARLPACADEVTVLSDQPCKPLTAIGLLLLEVLRSVHRGPLDGPLGEPWSLSAPVCGGSPACCCCCCYAHRRRHATIRRLASVFEQRRQAATVARVRFSRASL